MLSAPVGERRSTVGGCPWGLGAEVAGAVSGLKLGPFWANNFHPLCHSATPTTAQPLPSASAHILSCDPPGRSIVEAQQPISSPCTPSYRIVGNHARPPRAARRADSPPQPRGIPGPVAMAVIDHEDTAPLPSRVAGFYAISEPGIRQRRLGFLPFTRPGHWAMSRPKAKSDKHTPPLPLDLSTRRPDLWAASYKVRVPITPHISGVAG